LTDPELVADALRTDRLAEGWRTVCDGVFDGLRVEFLAVDGVLPADLLAGVGLKDNPNSMLFTLRVLLSLASRDVANMDGLTQLRVGASAAVLVAIEAPYQDRFPKAYRAEYKRKDRPVVAD
jgi:hypothetical protein